MQNRRSNDDGFLSLVVLMFVMVGVTNEDKISSFLSTAGELVEKGFWLVMYFLGALLAIKITYDITKWSIRRSKAKKQQRLQQLYGRYQDLKHNRQVCIKNAANLAVRWGIADDICAGHTLNVAIPRLPKCRFYEINDVIVGKEIDTEMRSLEQELHKIPSWSFEDDLIIAIQNKLDRIEMQQFERNFRSSLRHGKYSVRDLADLTDDDIRGDFVPERSRI